VDCVFGSNTFVCSVCGIATKWPGVPRNCVGVFVGEESVKALSDSLDLARTDAPSFLTKVRNFASAAVSHVAAGMPMASDAEIIRRHDICLTCEHLKDNACNLCGCPVARVAGYVSKLSWADQECPAGKWGKADAR